MHQQLQQEAPEQEILQALRMTDREHSGFILVSELRAKLTALGEKLTDQEGGKTSSSFHWPLACFVFVEKFENILLDVVSSNPLAKCCIGNMLQPSTHPPGGGGDVLRPDLSTHEKLKTFQSHVPLC